MYIEQNKIFNSAASAALSAAIIIAALLAPSCKQDLLPGPEMEKIQNSIGGKNAQIDAPLTVKATHGKTKVITLSWSTSNSATQYLIYSAEAPYEEFIQIAETKGETNSIDIQEPAGASVYYKVRAKNYEGAVSAFSDTVFGSTMATPIISDITSNTDGTAATVSWWMENCSESTYQNLVNYVVYCYDESGNEAAHATASGEKTSAVLSGLTAKTRYYYQVEAFISADQSNPEYSDKVDEETARRLIPDAPEALSATKGTDKETIEIRWTLPQFCDVAASGGVYERHPLYFTVERKLKGEDDSKYQKIISYLGTQRESSGTSVINFSCDPDKAQDSAVSVDPPTQGDADAERSDIYPDYISRSIVTYYDTDDRLERGKQYDYRVQSYVDDVKKTISSENAAAVAEGFLLSKPAFSASAVYSYADGDSNTITKIKVSFKTVFESYGQDYSYILYRDFTPMNGGDTDTRLIASANSIVTLNMENDVFDFSTQDVKIGYYQYKLLICAPGDDKTVYDEIVMGGKITVIDDASKLPTITQFDIEDGYADKFKISWNYDENCTYRLEWKSSLDDFAEVQALDLADADFTYSDSGKTATYEHKEALSGEIRTYTLVANGGVEVSKTYPLPKDGEEETPEQEKLYTLGTAAPQTDDIGYSAISVSWADVQKADGDFTIKAYYADDAGKTDLADGKTEITKEADGWRCTITEPDGCDDPARSGRPITMEITAKNGTTGDTTTATHTVCTLGPAALDVQTSETPAENEITITWKKAEGAAGYLIYRLAYADSGCAEVERTSRYYYEASGGATEVLGDLESNPNDGGRMRAEIAPENSDTRYTLHDMYQEPTNNGSSYQSAQSRLSWGRPYGYVVLPVKDKDDFAFEQDTAVLDADNSAVNYTANGTLVEIRGSTLGYGLNLAAAKAASGSSQKIEWEEPYSPQNPVVYRRAADSADNFEKFYENDAIKGKTACTMTIDGGYFDAFEYVVKYYPASAYPDTSISLPPSLSAEIKGSTNAYDTPQGEKTEQDNKGYLLTIDGFAAHVHPDKDYYEQLSWKDWDYSKRAVGPDSMSIYVQNNNIDADYHELASIEQANARKGIQVVADDIAAEAEATSTLRVAPKGIAADASGTTDGMLKVLRDYKHSYIFMLKRADGDAAITVSYADYEKNDYIKTAYRQITPQEFTRIANLVLAEGLYRVNGTGWNTAYNGFPTYAARTKNAAAPGSGTVRAESNFGVSSWDITYTDYEPALQTKTGESVKVAKANGTFNPKTSAVNQYPQSYEGGPITITLSGGTKQTGTIQFNTLKSDSGTMTVTFNGKTESFSADNYFNTPLVFSGGNYKYNDEQWQ